MIPSVQVAAKALSDGALILLPTETVYGLGADASNAVAVAAIYQAKGRPSFNPLIAHVADLEAARAVAVLDERALLLANAFWPGPLTLVAPIRAPELVCDLARAGLDSVAVRVPGHDLALAVLRAFGKPVVAPSANRSGRPSPTCLLDAQEETGFAVAAFLEGGACQVGLESTVVSVIGGQLRLLRPGAITRAQIEAVAGPLSEETHQSDGHRSPGRLSLHYAPDAPVRLNVTEPLAGEAYLGFGPMGAGPFNLSLKGDLAEAAANLFAFLRAADRTGPSAIAIAPIPLDGLGEAINDRLNRAAGFVG
jgi:L-threonylcarbamoyladenylate synthase